MRYRLVQMHLKKFFAEIMEIWKSKTLGDAEIVKQATGQQAIINSSNNELKLHSSLAKFITKSKFYFSRRIS